MSVFQQPTPEQLAGFIEGDPIAIDEIVALILPPIVRWATKQYPNIPEQEVESVVNQVMAEICIHPERYDPTRGTHLTTYVINLVKLRMNDAWKQQEEISSIEIMGRDAHEKLLGLPYNEVEDINTLTAREIFFQRVSEHLTEVEREFLQVWRTGEKSSDVFAEILMRYTTVDDTGNAVKNMKERLARRLRIIAEEMGVSLQDLIE